MNNCYFCHQSLENYFVCYNCKISSYKQNIVAYFLFDENKINIVNLSAYNIRNHDKICKIIYFYKECMCWVELYDYYTMPSIKFEIKPSQFTSLEQFKKIIEKYLRFNYLK